MWLSAFNGAVIKMASSVREDAIFKNSKGSYDYQVKEKWIQDLSALLGQEFSVKWYGSSECILCIILNARKQTLTLYGPGNCDDGVDQWFGTGSHPNGSANFFHDARKPVLTEDEIRSIEKAVKHAQAALKKVKADAESVNIGFHLVAFD